MGCTSGSLVWIVVVETKRVSQDSCKPDGSQFPWVLQVGQVWFPNFQYTIQALIDFSKEGLTLIILEKIPERATCCRQVQLEISETGVCVHTHKRGA